MLSRLLRYGEMFVMKHVLLILPTFCVLMFYGCKLQHRISSSIDVIPISSEDFGIVGDGKTDNTKAFKNLNRYCQSQDKMILLDFRKGIYLYKNNDWLTNIKNIIVEANGSSFKCIYSKIKSEECRPIHIKGPHRKASSHRFDYNNGDKFTYISKNKIKPSNDVYDSRPGDRILISGFEQQFTGYPPNPRYFQYNKISKVENGVLTLEKNLNTKYSAQWKDYCWGNPERQLCSGAPRMINLEQTDYIFPNHLEIRDATFLPNPYCEARNALVLRGSNVILRNVNCEALYPSIVDKYLYEGGTIADYIEFDKVVDSLIFNNVTVTRKENHDIPSSMQAATSVNYLIFKNCHFESNMRVSPRNLIATDCYFDLGEEFNGKPLINCYNAFFPVDNIEIKNVTQNGNLDILGCNDINSYPVKSTRNEELIIKESDHSRQHVLRSLDYGQIIYNPENDEFGKILSITQGSSEWVIEISWENKRRLTKSIETIQWNSVKKVSENTDAKTQLIQKSLLKNLRSENTPPRN